MKKLSLLLLFCLLLTSCAAPRTVPVTTPYTLQETGAGFPITIPSTEDPNAYVGLSPSHPARGTDRKDETCDHWDTCIHSYIDDETCLRSCTMCGDKTFSHDLHEDWAVNGLPCLWVNRCSFCKAEVGEGVFKHSYTESFQGFDEKTHAYRCQYENCLHWAGHEPHQLTASPYTREGHIYAQCTVCKGLVPTGETVHIPDCEKHSLSLGALDGKLALWEGKFDYLYPCQHCNELFSYKEYNAMKGQ